MRLIFITKLILFFLGFHFFLKSELLAQKFNFKNYNVNDGLAQPYIYTISQGKYGKLWIGTGDGLSGFDGNKFQNYTTKDGLAENFITTSCKDHNQNIWFGHYQGGLSFYDNNGFRTISKSLAKSPIQVIVEDINKNLWIGTQGDGLIQITPQLKITKHSEVVSNSPINSLVCLDDKYLLVATSDGIQVLDSRKPKLTIKTTLLEYTNVTKIAALKSNKFLIATQDEGIYELNIERDSFLIQPVSADFPLNGKNINILYPDTDQIVWIGCYGEGIYKFKYTPKGLVLVAQYDKTSGMSNDYIKSFYIDREGDIWMGTFGSGIEILVDPIFTSYGKSDGLLGDDITAVYSEDNHIWIANQGELTKLTLKKHKFNELSDKKRYKNLTEKSKITSIVSISKTELLLGTEDKGVWNFNVSSGKSSTWFNSKTNILVNKINHLTKDKENKVWVATEDGVYQFSPNSNKPTLHLTMESGLLHNKVFSIFIDSKNTAWFATHASGISSYRNNQVRNFPSPNETSGIDINSFAEDKNGNIWIATYGQGLYQFKNNKVIRRYAQTEGLGSNFCYLSICDKNNNLWIGHKNGMSKFDIAKQTFIFYNKKDGFLVEEINANACTQDFENNLWFGSVNGLLRYNLNVDKPRKLGPAVFISGIDLYFQKVDWKKYSKKLYTLSKLPTDLVLPYNKNHFTFHVRGISFADPDKVKYRYKLEGFQKDWSLETSEDFVTYPNIPPGNYVFKVVAANKEGIWTEHPTEFEFRIKNPFWRTWWFYLLILLIAFGIFLVVLKLRTRALEREQKILQEEKTKLLAEIIERKRAERKLKESEERLKETNKELNTFIYRASHDLKGPLSTVKGLTNLGQMEIKDEASLKYFGLISDRINRLDFILKDLINIVEIAEVTLVIEDLNLPKLVAEVIEEIKQIALPKPVKFQLNVDNKNTFMGDRKVTFSILLNLLDNAVRYYNNDRSDIIVSVDITDYKNGILIMVLDNGMGIAPEIQSRVFDMFFRGTDQSKGSGLGLYLVKKIVNRLAGKIKITSTPKSGTQIEIFLPSYDASIEEGTEKYHYPITSME